MEPWQEILNNSKVKDFSTFPFSLNMKKYFTKRSELLDEKFCSGILFFAPFFSKEITDCNISVYASVPDYHTVLKKLLGEVKTQLEERYPKETFHLFIDSSPISEIDVAVKAGLGFLGKNGLFIHPTYGSYGFLGEIITTLKLPSETNPTNWCLSCGACQRACPGRAIQKDGEIEEEKCLSFITQKKGELSEQEKSLMKKGGLIWGCDICQQVCPMNRGVKETYLEEFKRDIITQVGENTLIGKDYKKRAFGFRGKQVLIRNINILKESDK